MIREKEVRISGNPSLYHRGWVLYMGGATRYCLAGLAAQASRRAALTSCRTGSMRWNTDVGPSASEMKLEMHETMQAVDSERTFPKAEAKLSRWPQLRTWQDLRRGLALREFLFRYLRTFESPTREKRCDIVTDDNWIDSIMFSLQTL